MKHRVAFVTENLKLRTLSLFLFGENIIKMKPKLFLGSKKFSFLLKVIKQLESVKPKKLSLERNE